MSEAYGTACTAESSGERHDTGSSEGPYACSHIVGAVYFPARGRAHRRHCLRPSMLYLKVCGGSYDIQGKPASVS